MFGRLFSKDGAAYSYLPDSVNKFPEGEDFLNMMAEAGFSSLAQRRLSGGVATIYTGSR
jgi:demethylmenaquinone methyltransferase/2-methoxy-6-polyprenyl-1,4-benzoquinol methylase